MEIVRNKTEICWLDCKIIGIPSVMPGNPGPACKVIGRKRM